MTATYRRWPPTQPTAAPATQLDLLDLVEADAADDRLRDLYDRSELVFDTDRCRRAAHHECTGIVRVDTGEMLYSTVSSSSGPCRCNCHG